MSVVAILIFLAVLGIMLYTARKHRQEILKGISELDDSDYAMDEIQEDSMGKYPLFIREAERPWWDGLSRKQKRSILQIQDKKIKSGEYVPVKDEHGDTRYITKSEAKKHGII
jgi:hypothetical protein